jgi:hypothetical protein
MNGICGERTYATIFRFDLAPQRDVVPLHEIKDVKEFTRLLV